MRTPEQEAADAALAQAIHEAAQASFPGAAMVMDYVVLVQREDPNRPGTTTYNYLLPAGQLPWHRILGMMTVFDRLMAQELADSDAPDE